MLTHAKRIFMNAADSGSGNGAQSPAAPAEPTAAPTAPVFNPDDLVSRLMGAVEQKLAAHHNATNAALRKAGVFKQDKPTVEHPTPTPNPQKAPGAPTPAESSGLSMADVEAMLERERVIATRSAQHGLSEAQTRRLKSALNGVSVDVLATEADSYLSDLGLVKAQPPAAQAASQTAPEPQRAPAAAPSAPAGHPLPTQNGVIDLFNLSRDQLEGLGPQGVRGELEKLWKIGSQMNGAPQRPKPPSR